LTYRTSKGNGRSDKEVPSEEGRFDSKGLSTLVNAKRESHDHQEIGGVETEIEFLKG